MLISAALNSALTFCTTTLPLPMRHAVNGSKPMKNCVLGLHLQRDHCLRLCNISKLRKQLELPSAKQPFILRSLLALSPLLFCLSIQFSSAAFTGLTFDVLPKQATVVKTMLIMKTSHMFSLFSVFHSTIRTHILSHPSSLTLSLACLPGLKTIPTEQMNNIHDSTASIQRVTVVLLCPPELLVALVKISSLLLQLFGSSSPRVPITLEGNIYLTLLRLFPSLFLLSTRRLISLLSLCIIHGLSVSKKLYFKNEQTTGI